MSQKKSGQLFVKDKHGAPVVFEWFKTSIVSKDFAVAMKDTWSFARNAYTPVEMQFLKAFPDVVGKEPYFKQFEPLFASRVENVDWNAAEGIMEEILQGHFVFDPTQLPEEIIKTYENDNAFFVTAKDQAADKTIGFITFLIGANYAVGDVKVFAFAVDVAHQKRGLGKLLMSSIFKIIPDIKRILLATRVTNDIALKAYGSWGFGKDENPIVDHDFKLDHWLYMEYKVEHVHTLQNVAAGLLD